MEKHALRASAGDGDSLVWTRSTCTPRQLRELLSLEPDEGLGEGPIATHDGEWRLDPNGQWRHWDHADVAAERAKPYGITRERWNADLGGGR